MKRKYDELSVIVSTGIPNLMSMLDGEENVSKRKKLGDIKSSLFKHPSDHEQFLEIFESVEESELIQIMNVSHDISKEIAEYSTGNWKECGDTNCDGLVSVLKEYGTFECLRF